MAEGAGRLGAGRRTHRAAAQGRRFRDLHARQPRRLAGLGAAVLCRAAGSRARRRGAAGRARRRARRRACCRSPESTRRRAAASTRLSPRILADGVEGRAQTSTSPRSSSRCRRRHSRRSASSISNRSSPSASGSSWRCASTRVLAAPGFEQWFEGEPLDPARLLYTADGRPRVRSSRLRTLATPSACSSCRCCSTRSLGWMRGLTGTSSLRAVVYMDEIAGFFPPVANPPSKGPLLTLLKQGRAFGLGVVLATQNPVDLDYKGLSNIGTWFLGPAADRARQGARARRTRGGGGRLGRSRRRSDSLLSALAEARVPPAQRARREAS